VGGVDARVISQSAGFVFTDVPYVVGNFTATAAMTWTVDLADQVTFRMGQLGRMLWLNVRLTGTTVGGVVAGANLQILIPGGFTIRNESIFPALAAPGGGASEGAIGFATAGSNKISVLRYAANWVLGANNTDVGFNVLIERN
jgi:hypothetical protein